MRDANQNLSDQHTERSREPMNLMWRRRFLFYITNLKTNKMLCKEGSDWPFLMPGTQAE